MNRSITPILKPFRFFNLASQILCLSAASLLAVVVTTSCINDPLSEAPFVHTDGSISFTATNSSEWTASRSAGLRTTLIEATCDNGDRPMFLNAVTTDGVRAGVYDMHRAEGLKFGVDKKGDTYVTETGSESDGSNVSADNPKSRAAQVTVMYNTFLVSAYVYTGAWDANSTPNYFENLTATKGADNSYRTAKDQFMPGKQSKVRFFAMAPIGSTAYTASPTKGLSHINVEIPGNVAQQTDLVVAESGELSGDANSSIQLDFKHPLTAIRFVTGSDMAACVIEKIEIRGVHFKGTLNVAKKQWTRTADKCDFVLDNLNREFPESTSGSGITAANSNITSPAETFMMLPDPSLPTGAKIVVTMNENGTKRTVSADISGKEWPAGKTIVYQISNTKISYGYSLSMSNNYPEGRFNQ